MWEKRLQESQETAYKYFLYTEPKVQYYGGQATKVFPDDDNSDVTQIEVNFLEKKDSLKHLFQMCNFSIWDADAYITFRYSRMWIFNTL